MSVVFGNRLVEFRKDLEFGFANGCGTEEARTNLAAWLETIGRVDEETQRAHLGLSTESRFVYAQRRAMAHNVHYMASERISDEILWVLGLTGRQFDGWES